MENMLWKMPMGMAQTVLINIKHPTFGIANRPSIFLKSRTDLPSDSSLWNSGMKKITREMLIKDPMAARRAAACSPALVVTCNNNNDNKPNGLKVAKEELRSIGLMVDGLNG